MADELDVAMSTLRGDDPSDEFVVALRARLLAVASASVAPEGDKTPNIDVEWRPIKQENQPMNTSRWTMATIAAAVVALIIALAVVGTNNGDADHVADRPDTVASATTQPSTEPTPPTAPAATAPPSVGTPDADADGGCGLSDKSAVVAAPDDLGESVTIDVTSDESCAGVDIRVVATPWSNGFAIDRPATLDETGAATVSDHLLGTRTGQQKWTVELLVAETGGVAATSEFEVAGLCDLDEVDLQATHIPATDEVSIVLQLDPLCAGRTFTFDHFGIFASSTSGGWAKHTVDANGRIEVTEQLVVDGPVIDVIATPVADDRGIASGGIARVTLEIGG